MRTLSKFIKLAAVAVTTSIFLVQCNKIDEPEINPEEQGEKIIPELIVNFNTQANPLSKVVITDNNDGTAKTAWEATDEIKVKVVEAGQDMAQAAEIIYATTEEGCKTGHFTIKDPATAPWLFKNKSYDWSISYTKGSFAGEGLIQDCTQPTAHLSNSILIAGESKNALLNDAAVTINAGFQMTLMAFEIKNISEMPLTLSQIDFIAPAGTIISSNAEANTQNIKLSNAPELAKNETLKVYVNMPTFSLKTNDIFTIKMTTDKGIATFDKTANAEMVFANGTMNTLTTDLLIENKPLVAVTIPDPEFKNYLLTNFDANQDGVLSEEEAALITIIDVKTNNIKDITGIEHMPNLEELNVTSDWDGKTNTSLGQLTSIDATHNTKLKKLTCHCNKITSLNVTGLTALTELGFGGNLLTTVDLSTNTELTILHADNNKLTELDLSNNKKITDANCTANPNAVIFVWEGWNPEINKISVNNRNQIHIKGSQALTEMNVTLPSLSKGQTW